MTNQTLARDYFKKARIRLKALYVLRDEGGHSDVVRESQELVLKGTLRQVGVDPPKWHDMAPVLREQQHRLPPGVCVHLERICRFSTYLRKEREISFYGDEDFLPTENYTAADAQRCIAEVEWLLELLGAEMSL